MSDQAQTETAVLGGLMLAATSWDRVGHSLSADDFLSVRHKNIFNAIRKVASEGSDVDVFTVADRMQADGQLRDGGDYLREITQHTHSAANIEALAGQLRDAALRREIHKASGRMANLTGTGRERLIQAQAIVTGLEAHDPQEPKPISEHMAEWWEQLNERVELGDSVGLSTGFCDIDRRLGGMRPGDLYILAGRPAQGKTAFAMNVIKAACVRSSCVKFSLEMDRASLLDRMTSLESGVSLELIRTPHKLADSDWPKLTEASSSLRAMPLFIDDQPSLSIEEIHSRARRVARKYALGLVVVDYLQLVETERRHQTRRDHVAEVSRQLKKIAKELQVPVLALSQLNRKCEERADKRPLMADLYESGAVEQDADAIGFLYRDEVYNENTAQQGVCEVIWRKVRNGKAGTDYLWFDGDTQTFRQADRHSVPKGNVSALRGPYDDTYRRSSA